MTRWTNYRGALFLISEENQAERVRREANRNRRMMSMQNERQYAPSGLTTSTPSRPPYPRSASSAESAAHQRGSGPRRNRSMTTPTGPNRGKRAPRPPTLSIQPLNPLQQPNQPFTAPVSLQHYPSVRTPNDFPWYQTPTTSAAPFQLEAVSQPSTPLISYQLARQINEPVSYLDNSGFLPADTPSDPSSSLGPSPEPSYVLAPEHPSSTFYNTSPLPRTGSDFLLPSEMLGAHSSASSSPTPWPIDGNPPTMSSNASISLPLAASRRTSITDHAVAAFLAQAEIRRQQTGANAAEQLPSFLNPLPFTPPQAAPWHQTHTPILYPPGATEQMSYSADMSRESSDSEVSLSLQVPVPLALSNLGYHERLSSGPTDFSPGLLPTSFGVLQARAQAASSMHSHSPNSAGSPFEQRHTPNSPAQSSYFLPNRSISGQVDTLQGMTLSPDGQAYAQQPQQNTSPSSAGRGGSGFSF